MMIQCGVESTDFEKRKWNKVVLYDVITSCSDHLCLAMNTKTQGFFLLFTKPEIKQIAVLPRLYLSSDDAGVDEKECRKENNKRQIKFTFSNTRQKLGSFTQWAKLLVLMLLWLFFWGGLFSISGCHAFENQWHSLQQVTTREDTYLWKQPIVVHSGIFLCRLPVIPSVLIHNEAKEWYNSAFIYEQNQQLWRLKHSAL